MPIYEYRCPHCEISFDKLRPFSQADAPAPCPQCGGQDTARAISRFAFHSSGGNGEASHSSNGGGGCAGCTASSCAGCHH